MPPLNAADTNLCMGAGIGVSTGFAHFVDNPVIATIGDSTFFHAGMPALVNAVFNSADLTLLVFDNATTAMTGHQPHPGAGRKAGNRPAPAIDIAGVCKAFGVKYVKVVSGFDMDGLVAALEGAVAHQGPAVVIAKAPCQLERLRELRSRGLPAPLYQIDEQKCKNCGLCINHYGCPAMYWEGEEIKIDPLLCGGCGACSSEQVCHLHAIYEADREALRTDKRGAD
jgi:indolepyruvate ferredoxin oxidoreductase alpha subunit